MKDRTRVTAAGLLLGLGLGGFFDGIVFHQLLGWHHLVCRTDTCQPHTVAEAQQQIFEDGLFHALCWLLSVAGVYVLARGERLEPIGRPLIGWAVAGWGVFNIVEGTIDHLILKIHHVRPGPNQFAWDIGFLAWGLAFLLIGLLIARRAPRPAAPQFQTL